MKYSFEYKIMSIDLYRQGKWPETPNGANKKEFRHMIRERVRIEEACGLEALNHKKQKKEWTAEEKYELVAKVLAGASIKENETVGEVDN